MKQSKAIFILIVLTSLLLPLNSYVLSAEKTPMELLFGMSADDLMKKVDEGIQLEKLKGIKDVYIVIESLPPSASQLGLSEEQIRTDVEIKLRRAGIIVKEKGSAVMFYVNVNVTDDIDKLYGVSITVDVKDMVALVRDPNIKFQAPIWHEGMLGIVRQLRVKEIVRENVGDLTDKFILDYLKAKQD